MNAKIIVIAFIAGLLGGFLVNQFDSDSYEDRVAEWYAAETAVSVSPHHIRKHMAKGDQSFILVDLRSPMEYEAEHIRGAINIPAYKDPDTSAYGDVERIVSSFKALPKDKEVIVYCYSIPCMTGRKIGNLLAENGVYVKHLGVGWNEWRYFWTMWNHPHEWNNTHVEDYLWTGTEPGDAMVNVTDTSCPIEGPLGC
ncbi:MAG: rhodanese-like domain-containing protein [Candidatus Woesearchaeota archaeon]|jgi:rhodanese-related sulfurtransferase|nr:rhodanese-like domain-containing protein [Candidatus Woesearchaeota archaeon]MDP7198655.1 rhodanese-like domain-containing protein [Candidatus Woesearchaeota archaeon]MDP7467629.1 rhodanese-like domain-containing protein [Candidatus Woesearchaeota archaeon]MDP7647153.1 rhodanese-like domain-containing protein [Candidatus Woesearchaeota archaeon]